MNRRWCREKALQCLNHLVTNALVHMPDCLEYLSRLHTPEVFKFCAIPQVRSRGPELMPRNVEEGGLHHRAADSSAFSFWPFRSR